MTNNWVDIKNANLILVQGGNPAEAHPVGFRWAIEAKKNGAKIIVVDPRFNRTASVADLHAPIRSGSDIAFLMGVIRYLLETNQIQHEYVKHYTNASFLINEGYKFEDGLFSGFNEEKRNYDKSTWNYQFDENGNAKRDMTLQHPRCVINILKDHVSRYTPEMVERVTGVKQKSVLTNL
ncbi:putative molybdopterin oxidoreductase [Haemophilus haemolyticus M21621]|nr:putative molybdopterin oxidoreductase [Haemophilus haemolyticus M21621]EGT80633.1 putative molybdopterin oxidoreductase [Haemophilus haemolyticus M21621]